MTATRFSNGLRHAEIHLAKRARKAAAPKAPARDGDDEFTFAVSAPKAAVRGEAFEFSPAK